MIVGQEKLCWLIDNSSLDTFPRSLMLVGLRGAGKHLVCDYVAHHLGLPMSDITDSLDLETIDAIYQKVEPSIYTIRINEISVQKENLILKFLEEPLKNTYIILIAETEIGVLQTVLNRCQIWHMQHYSKEVLSSFITNGNDKVLEVAQTPGQVLTLCSYPFDDMIALADKIVNRIGGASIPNTMKLSTQVAYKNEKDKFDVFVFTDMLLSRITKAWASVQTQDTKLVDAYLLTSDLKRNLAVKNTDSKALFEKYLLELRKIMRGSLL